MGFIQIKRIYDTPEDSDGYRVLVDRLWPRGVSKERAALTEWNKDITPSPDLRIWFGHKAENFKEFKERYRAELDQSQEAHSFVEKAQDILQSQNISLLYAARDPQINHAIILKEWLEAKLDR